MIEANTVEDAFQKFRENTVEQFRVKLRRFRAAQITALAADPDAVSLGQFNRDVWAFESGTLLDGQPVPKKLLVEPGGGLTAADAAAYDRALDDGRLELHGNYVWAAGSGVYAPGGNPADQLANARAALRTLADPAHTPAEKARRIDALPGFGDCAATGLVMLAHPAGHALFNGPAAAAARTLGLPADGADEFQASVRELRDCVGAADFIELDWFLYLLSQGLVRVGGSPAGGPAAPASSPQALDAGPPGREFWVIAPGEGGRLWKECRDGGIIAIGWDDIGDLRQYATKDDVLARLAAGRKPDAPRPTMDALACHEFCRVMKPGDVVFVKKGVSKVLGVGRVTGGYEYRPDRREYRNVRTVDWQKDGQWDVPEDARPPLKTLTNITRYDRFLRFGRPLLDDGVGLPPPPPLPPSRPGYTIQDALTGTFLSEEQFRAMAAGLTRKKNLIVQGPPGVGKSFLARRLAYFMAGAADPARVQVVQFHQSYSYEDFVQGWRPAAGGFERRDGVFFHFCRRAVADPGANYVFVVDEINRGNLSKVFGELFLLIEADKRGKDYAIPLTYAAGPDETFFVPDNVYLVGLMNTADRSLAMVDYALRRRFAFAELRPGFTNSGFRAYLIGRGVEPDVADRVVGRMTALNDAIRADAAGLGPGFEVGHSFFCPHATEDALDLGWYRAVVEGEVAPLLREYWFDDPARADAAVAELLR